MSLALLFGFLDSIWPDASISFKRLHIFLFNLVSGGTLVVYFTEGQRLLTRNAKIYFGLALLYALSAAAGYYALTLLISVPLLIVLELVRTSRFSFFPFDFFRKGVPASEKLHHASALCLSIAVVIASLVIVNNEYYEVVSCEKLTLDVFFLGYSFPVSLITMSLMFSFMTERRSAAILWLEELAFWTVNLGVITFFLFILLEMFVLEITAAAVLFLTVWMIFRLFIKTAPAVQQKTFLISGMSFLLLTAITGILYILRYFFSPLEGSREFLLTFHAVVSLYGWNLSGLIIIMRWWDFPIRLNSSLIIGLHWAIVLLFVPVGKYVPVVSVIAMPAYIVLLGLVSLSRGVREAQAQ